jgi:hypothetical protein
MTCEHCLELKEEIAWLRQRLGEQEDLELLHRLRTLFGFSPAEARLAQRLYQAKGIVSHGALEDVVHADPSRDYDRGNLNTVMKRVRDKLGGYSSVDRAPCIGYVLSVKGRETIDAALRDNQPPPYSKPDRRYRPWTTRELKELGLMVAQRDASWAAIGAALGRTAGSAWNAANRYL